MLDELRGSEPLIHRAVVQGIDQDLLVYLFDNPHLNSRATSGAPLVVDIHLGGEVDPHGLIGMANPIERFRGPLEKTLKASGKVGHR